MFLFGQIKNINVKDSILIGSLKKNKEHKGFRSSLTGNFNDFSQQNSDEINYNEDYKIDEDCLMNFNSSSKKDNIVLKQMFN